LPGFVGNSKLLTVGGDIDQDAEVLFDYQPNGDMMALRMDSQENNLKLYQWVQGQPTVLKLAENVPAALARWHDISVTVSVGGTHVSGSLDGQKFVDADVDTPISGQVGAWAKSDTVVLFDSFSVDANAD